MACEFHALLLDCRPSRAMTGHSILCSSPVKPPPGWTKLPFAFFSLHLKQGHWGSSGSRQTVFPPWHVLSLSADSDWRTKKVRDAVLEVKIISVAISDEVGLV